MGLADGVAWENEFGTPKHFECSLCKSEGITCTEYTYTKPNKCREGREHNKWIIKSE